MSCFLNNLVIRVFTAEETAARCSNVQLYELAQDLKYQSDVLGCVVTVPEGYITDFASIPRIVWNILDPEDPIILYPSVVHDYLYSNGGKIPEGTFSRLQADKLIREGMDLSGSSKWKRFVVFNSVRAFGTKHWN